MAAKIPGSMRIQCTTELKREIKRYGSEKCVLVLDEIKALPGVKDAWFTNDRSIDIMVEVEVNSYDHADTLASQIKAIDGVEDVRPRIAIEV